MGPMKLLVVVGTPGVALPGMGIEVRAQESWFSVDTIDVVERLSVAGSGNDVTVLYMDRSLFAGPRDVLKGAAEAERLKLIAASSYDDMLARLKYLAFNVTYDVVVSLVKLPAWTVMGVYSSHNDPLEEEGVLFSTSNEQHEFDHDPFVRMRRPDVKLSPYHEVVYGLRSSGCDASVICLEAIERVDSDRTPHALIDDRLKRIRDGLLTLTILDDVEPLPDKRGAYVVGKNGGVPIHASRMTEYIVSATKEAGEIAREARGGTKGDDA